MNEDQLFEWPVQERKPVIPRAEYPLHDRTEGWFLVASRRRKVGTWHRIRATNAYSGVQTKCGFIGRIVPDEEARITHCPECEAAAD